MRKHTTTVALAIGLALALASSAEAQPWRFDLGANGGGSWFRPALDSDELGVDSDVEFDPSWLAGAQATLWLSNRFGLRANFGFDDRALGFDGDEDLVGGNQNVIDHVNLWSGTGDIMLRLATPGEEYLGPEFLPYLTAGFGMRWVNPAADRLTLNGDDTRTGEPFTINDRSFVLEEKAKRMVRVGLGADARLSRNFALRLEVGDMIWTAPIHEATSISPTNVAVGAEDIGDTQQEIYGTLGLHVLMGMSAPERVATLSAPPPPPPARQPPPQPQPQPEPEPEPEVFEPVCVADPNGDNGIAFVTPRRDPATGDVVIDQQGRIVRVDAPAGPVTTNVTALRIQTTRMPLEFTPYGEPMAVTEDIVYIGNVGDTPVYVRESSLRTLAPRTAELRADGDLTIWLERDPANVRVFEEEVTQIYVPAHAVGCEFTVYQRMEPVIKRQ